MPRCEFNRRLCGFVLLGTLVLAGTASAQFKTQTEQLAPQESLAEPAKDAAKPATEIVIPDQPRAVDSLQFMPKSVTDPRTVKFDEMALSDVIDWLRNEAKLTVILDQRSLRDADILPSEPVTDQLNNEPLYLLLDRLGSLGIDWWLSAGVLHLGTSDADENLYTKQYNVGDLFDRGHTADNLQEVITGAIEPVQWEEVGGGGTIIVLGDVLFVRQSNRLHRQVAGLLEALRSHGRRTWVDDPAQHEAIREALATPVTANYRNAALLTVVAELGKAAKIDMRLDQQALRESGVRDRLPVTLSFDQQPLRVALDLLTRQYDLAWHLKHGVLWVTTENRVAEGVTAVFDVRDLCRDFSESNALTDAITSQSDPDSWDIVGGPGVIEFPLPGAMVVHHSERHLDAVLKLLEDYRAALRISKPRVRPESDPKAVITRYYRMPTDVAADLAIALPELLKPETWRNPQQPDAPGAIRKLNAGVQVDPVGENKGAAAPIPQSVLVITQMREVHDELPTLFLRVQNGDGMVGGFDGGMGGMGGGGMGGGFGGGFFAVPHEPLKRAPAGAR
ncbi:MAG: hypothetical protein KDB14_03220 [Planctomycetales bacterium]|nr:hypothetical protein [Planctomycetales bacterium]